MSTASSASPSRLPSYHSSYLRRYHPYPMTSRRRDSDIDYLMCTVDYRTGPGGLETIPEEPEAIRLKPVIVTTCEERPDTDVSSLELESPAGEGSQQAELVEATTSKKGRLAAMLLAVRRKLLVLLAVAETRK